MAHATLPSVLPSESALEPWAARAAVVSIALLPVAVWPWQPDPFSSPKLWVLVAGTCAVLLATPRRDALPLPRALAWLGGIWMATFVAATLGAGLDDLRPTLLGIVCVAFAMAVARSGVAPSRVVAAQAVGATVVAAVALLQWMGADLFAAIGWHAPVEGASIRMRVFGTLGNPNFVGALMAMSLGLVGAAAHEARTGGARVAAVGAAGLQAGALLATGSRGAVLGLAVGAIAWAAVRWSGRAVGALVVVLAFGGAAIALSPARPLDTTIAGRVYLWRVVAPFAMQDLVTGLGPGVFEIRFPEWQREAAARGDRDRRFLGLADHAHNDYLEALVERGIPGLISVIAAIVVTWRTARTRHRPASPIIAAALSTVVAGAACALVDFPLARPVELTWWWLAITLIVTPAGRPANTTQLGSDPNSRLRQAAQDANP